MKELTLYIGKKSTGVTVFADSEWPNMWRIRNREGRVSDMVNLSRAKDAAICWARPKGLGGAEVPKWHHRQTA